MIKWISCVFFKRGNVLVHRRRVNTLLIPRTSLPGIHFDYLDKEEKKLSVIYLTFCNLFSRNTRSTSSWAIRSTWSEKCRILVMPIAGRSTTTDRKRCRLLPSSWFFATKHCLSLQSKYQDSFYTVTINACYQQFKFWIRAIFRLHQQHSVSRLCSATLLRNSL